MLQTNIWLLSKSIFRFTLECADARRSVHQLPGCVIKRINMEYSTEFRKKTNQSTNVEQTSPKEYCSILTYGFIPPKAVFIIWGRKNLTLSVIALFWMSEKNLRQFTEAVNSRRASTSAGPEESGSACSSTGSVRPLCRHSASFWTHTHTQTDLPDAPDERELICDRHSLGDTHGVLTLGHQRLLVVLPLRSDCNQLQGVGTSAELSVHWSHLFTGAVGQVDASNGTLTPRREKQGVS